MFNYQATLRGLTQLEDNIKLSVRRDLRALNLDRQQYVNDIAGAALVSERVTSTELEVRGGFATSRDFLESQTAYVQAVSNVASRHINYIVGRLQLFLDLESLEVGDNGFWDELYDERLSANAKLLPFRLRASVWSIASEAKIFAENPTNALRPRWAGDGAPAG